MIVSAATKPKPSDGSEMVTPPSEWEKGEVGKWKDRTSSHQPLRHTAPVGSTTPPKEKKGTKDLKTQPSVKELKSHPSTKDIPNNHKGKEKDSQVWGSGSTKLRKREQKLLTNSRFNELMEAWGLPPNEELIKAFDVAYRKPLNAHGSLYIFNDHLCFSNRTRNIKWAVLLSDINKIEVKKGNHSPKTFVFLHLGEGYSYGLHKFRGRTGRSRNEMVATVLLAWEHAKGNTSVDMGALKVAGTYALKHPLLKSLLGHDEATNQEEEEDEEERSEEHDSNESVKKVVPSDNSEFWGQFHPLVLPPDVNGVLPEELAACQPANLAQPDRETIFPVSMEKTWLLLFSDKSTLVADYQLKNGAFELHTDPWTDKQNHLERMYGFSKPIQSRIMSGTCVVKQLQRACLLKPGTLLHFGESSMTGVPKGDCFKLKSMYEITDLEGGSCKIRYWAWVDWHKSGGLLKGPIGAGTARAAIDSFGTQMEYVKSKIPTTSVPLNTSNGSTPTAMAASSGSVPSSLNSSAETTATVTQKKDTGLFGSLSLVEKILLALVAFFLLTTLYYRWSASSLSAMVEELREQQALFKANNL